MSLKAMVDTINWYAFRTKSFWYFVLGGAWGMWVSDTVIQHHANRGALYNTLVLLFLSAASPWGFRRWEHKHGKVRNTP